MIWYSNQCHGKGHVTKQIPISVIGLSRLGLEPMIYVTQGEHTKSLHHRCSNLFGVTYV